MRDGSVVNDVRYKVLISHDVASRVLVNTRLTGAFCFAPQQVSSIEQYRKHN